VTGLEKYVFLEGASLVLQKLRIQGVECQLPFSTGFEMSLLGEGTVPLKKKRLEKAGG
jgi:hypothetical protein